MLRLKAARHNSKYVSLADNEKTSDIVYRVLRLEFTTNQATARYIEQREKLHSFLIVIVIYSVVVRYSKLFFHPDQLRGDYFRIFMYIRKHDCKKALLCAIIRRMARI